jgi:hypothetical protein
MAPFSSGIRVKAQGDGNCAPRGAFRQWLPADGRAPRLGDGLRRSACAGLRAYRAQRFLVAEGTSPSSRVERLRQGHGLTLIYTVVTALFCSILDPDTRRLLGGGLMAFNVCGAALNLASYWHLRFLRDDTIMTGQLRPSPRYGYANAAAQFGGLALTFAAAFAWTLDLAFLGALLFAGGSAAGHYRLFRHAAKRPPDRTVTS